MARFTPEAPPRQEPPHGCAVAVFVCRRLWITYRPGLRPLVTWPHTSARNSRRAKVQNLSQLIDLFGERAGARTRDPLIKSQMLYRLSYALACRGRVFWVGCRRALACPKPKKPSRPASPRRPPRTEQWGSSTLPRAAGQPRRCRCFEWRRPGLRRRTSPVPRRSPRGRR